MTCALSGFIATWLDPYAWRLRLSGIHIVVSGHIEGERRWEIRDGAEHEYVRCTRCRRELYTGWRWMA